MFLIAAVRSCCMHIPGTIPREFIVFVVFVIPEWFAISPVVEREIKSPSILVVDVELYTVNDCVGYASGML